MTFSLFVPPQMRRTALLGSSHTNFPRNGIHGIGRVADLRLSGLRPTPLAQRKRKTPLVPLSAYHSLPDASRAPSAIDRSLCQTIDGSTTGFSVAAVPNPQSLPAMTFSRPTSPAYRPIRWATSSGCSMKLVVESITPGMIALSYGNLTSSKTTHSCSCRGFAPSKDMADTFAFNAIPMISRSGISRWCGPS